MIGYHTSREWLSLLEAWKWKCFYCGNSLRIKFPDCMEPEHEATKDHAVPISRGGVDYIENIVTACLRCNRLKGNMTGEEFIASRQVFRVQKEKSSTCIALDTSLKIAIEEKDEPGLLKKVKSERDRGPSWSWRNPYPGDISHA